ncbi:hypothetical protein F2P81_006168 [Scophthalmus maximus]|uniref:BSD domain-containing protein n=1 Tax=Scophthalmus maximus TaxID=52904 RepID=A0A6A4T4Y4_SCOMX|nr:hypothetical protein F2P81_006168 [Scophthalmus maximus]
MSSGTMGNHLRLHRRSKSSPDNAPPHSYSMFKNWGDWFGTESENGQGKHKVEEEEEEGESVVDVSEDNSRREVNKPSAAAGSEETGAVDPHPLLQKAKGFSGYIYNFASSASKNLSETVVERAQTFKRSVEEGKINGIIDKTFLGDFQKEQEKFVQEKRAKKFGAAVPPWVGYNEEDTVQQQILALSAVSINPFGIYKKIYIRVKEEAFWKNYFYRVSLIKQSAQLTALAAQQATQRRDVERTACSPEDPRQTGVVKGKTPPVICRTKPKSSEDEEEISTSPPVSEFVSDTFDLCSINKDDLRKEMEQLVLDKRERPSAQQEETPDWERELQEELKEYDVLADNENHDENWDREIEDMLKEDS